MSGGETLASIAVALVGAFLLGPLLGRVATQWFAGRALSNLLTEMRGAFLPFLLAPVLLQFTAWPTWLIIGCIVATTQAISVGRWAARRSGEWSPSLIGGIALGRSRSALLSARAMARGAVVGTLATTTIQVILLEAVLAALELDGLDPGASIGASLHRGAGASTLFLVLLGGLLIVGSELLASSVFQRRGTSRGRSPSLGHSQTPPQP